MVGTGRYGTGTVQSVGMVTVPYQVAYRGTVGVLVNIRYRYLGTVPWPCRKVPIPDIVAHAGGQNCRRQVGLQIISDQNLDLLLPKVLLHVLHEDLKQEGTALFPPTLSTVTTLLTYREWYLYSTNTPYTDIIHPTHDRRNDNNLP